MDGKEASIQAGHWLCFRVKTVIVAAYFLDPFPFISVVCWPQVSAVL